MSQSNVERVIGKLVTDEAFRRFFEGDPHEALGELIASGIELNSCEQCALASLDPVLLSRFAEALDPRIQKIDPIGDEP